MAEGTTFKRVVKEFVIGGDGYRFPQRTGRRSSAGIKQFLISNRGSISIRKRGLVGLLDGSFT